MGIREIIEDIITLFVLINPIGSIPVFVEITSKMKKEQRAKTFNIATITAAAILLVFSVLGQGLLEKIFNIGINDIMIAGGLIMLTISIKSIMFSAVSKEELGSKSISDLTAVPMAFPLLVGPGTMVTGVLVLARQGYLKLGLILLILFLCVWLVVRFSEPLYKLLGEVGAKVLSKVMFVVLAAIATKYIMAGIINYIK